MATIRCPNCHSEISKPGSHLWLIILGFLGFVFIGGIMLIIVCLAAIVAIGANADEEFDRIGANIQAEAPGEFDLSIPLTAQADAATTEVIE